MVEGPVREDGAEEEAGCWFVIFVKNKFGGREGKEG